MLMEDHLPSKLVNCSSIRIHQGISMQNRAGHNRAPTLLRRGGWLVPASRQIEALLSVVLCCSSRLSSGASAHELRCDYCWCWLSRYHGKMIQMIHYPHYHSMHTSAYLVLYLSLCAMQCVWLSISEMHDIWHIWFDKINWKISKLDLVFLVFSRPVRCKDHGDPQVASTALCRVLALRRSAPGSGTRQGLAIMRNIRTCRIVTLFAEEKWNRGSILHSSAAQPVTHNR